MTPPETCVIIAAGRGSRLAGRTPSKPLLEVAGRRLIDRAIAAALLAGVRRFVVVTGYEAGAVEAHLAARAAAEGLSVETVRNDEWEKENGLSVLKARGRTGERFFLLMADHIVDPRLLEGLAERGVDAGGLVLAVDSRVEGHPYVDLDDVTRVRVEDGRIAEIGKRIEGFNAFDTGVFLCTPALFKALEESQGRGDFTLSGGVRALAARGRAGTWDAGDLFWIDVDDEAALAKAETAVAAGLDGRTGSGGSARRKPGGPARFLFCAAGFLLLVYLVWRIGFDAAVAQVARFGPWFLVITGIALGWLFLQACAWSLVQAAHFRRVPLLSLFRAKIIGDTLNALIPTASVGGDAARAFLIRRHAPLEEAIPGVLADKTIEFASGSLFLATGFLLSLLFVDLPGWMDAVAAVCLAGMAVGVAGLVLLQQRGAAWTLERLGRLVPGVRRFVARKEDGIRALDRNLRLVCGRLDARTGAAAALHYAARVLGAGEVLVVMKVLGSPVPVIEAVFIAAGVSIVNTALFVVPGHMGVMESAHVLILRSLGFAAETGLGVGLIRRLRKLATMSAGLVLLALDKGHHRSKGGT
ncbi:MAG: NTP transferase domain-containing protein [Acidobacteria bacterium]|nr:NTP transferase domain-containing protein [Acidobacteriota bacterium]